MANATANYVPNHLLPRGDHRTNVEMTHRYLVLSTNPHDIGRVAVVHELRTNSVAEVRRKIAEANKYPGSVDISVIIKYTKTNGFQVVYPHNL